MGIDLLSALAFAALTFRNPDRLWPGVAGCGQFLVFVFSATRALEFPLSELAYLCALNISGLTVLAALTLGTIVSRWFPPAPSEWDLAEERLATRSAQPA